MAKQSRKVKREIKQELRKFKRWAPFSSSRLIDYLHSIGWSIRTFDESQLNDLEFSNYARGKSSFAFKYDGGNFVFLKRSVTDEEEKVCLLLHEIGHILYQHDLENLSVWDETEASAFASKLRPNSSCQTKKSRLVLPGLCIFCLLCCSVLLFIYFHGKAQNHQQPVPSSVITATEEIPALSANGQLTMDSTVYITSSGSKYHRAGCRYIKNKSNIVALPLKKALELEKTPCSFCVKHSVDAAVSSSPTPDAG
jgi:hypothetical protein